MLVTNTFRIGKKCILLNEYTSSSNAISCMTSLSFQNSTNSSVHRVNKLVTYCHVCCSPFVESGLFQNLDAGWRTCLFRTSHRSQLGSVWVTCLATESPSPWPSSEMQQWPWMYAFGYYLLMCISSHLSNLNKKIHNIWIHFINKLNIQLLVGLILVQDQDQVSFCAMLSENREYRKTMTHWC